MDADTRGFFDMERVSTLVRHGQATPSVASRRFERSIRTLARWGVKTRERRNEGGGDRTIFAYRVLARSPNHRSRDILSWREFARWGRIRVVYERAYRAGMEKKPWKRIEKLDEFSTRFCRPTATTEQMRALIGFPRELCQSIIR